MSTARENIAGAKVLTGATGLTGQILSGKDKVNLTGRSAAEIAHEVLPALTATVAALDATDPGRSRQLPHHRHHGCRAGRRHRLRPQPSADSHDRQDQGRAWNASLTAACRRPTTTTPRLQPAPRRYPRR